LDDAARKARSEFSKKFPFLNALTLAFNEQINSFLAKQSEDTLKVFTKVFNNSPTGVGFPEVLRDLLTSLLFDGGIFVGDAVQQFLTDVVRDALTLRRNVQNANKSAKAGTQVTVTDKEARTLTFDDFQTEFGIRLAIPITDTGLGMPRVYTTSDLMERISPGAPPLSGVDAVGISMSIPFVFKPVPVRFLGNNPVGYCDGGAVNNFPLHIFDTLDRNGQLLRSSTELKLNPRMLGFMLSSAEPSISTNWFPATDKMFLPQMILNFLESVLYVGDRGQVPSPLQPKQVIKLNCGTIATLDFGAASRLAKVDPFSFNQNDPEGLIKGAFKQVVNLLR